MNKVRLEQIKQLRLEFNTVNQISDKLKIGKGTVGYYLSKIYENNIEEIKPKIRYTDVNKVKIPKTEEIINKIKVEKSIIYNEKLLKQDFITLGWDRKRERVILEQEHKCIKCKLDTWIGEKLILEIEHKDGNNKNNLRNNLEALCPNCHSLTSTWRGRNKMVRRFAVSDENLIRLLIKNNYNIRQSLIEADLTPKGGNYVRCHRLIKEISAHGKQV